MSDIYDSTENTAEAGPTGISDTPALFRNEPSPPMLPWNEFIPALPERGTTFADPVVGTNEAVFLGIELRGIGVWLPGPL
uniref:Uncharacterized protein n=1 Tax=Setaria digitata TaxID=48799 RepID=A0A915Q1P2_9BILA